MAGNEYNEIRKTLDDNSKDIKQILVLTIEISEWKKNHILAHEKEDKVTIDRLNSQSKGLRMLENFKNKSIGLLIGVPIFITIIIMFAKHYLSTLGK